MTDIKQITDPVAVHGEGPVWSPSWGGLRWVDQMTGDVLALDPASAEVSRFHVGDVAAAIRPRTGGGMIVALERSFALWDNDAGPSRTFPDLWDDPTVRLNEGGCDPQGRFYCGSMAYDYENRRGCGTLLRLDPDGSIETVLDHVSISNGIAWAPDGSTVYYIDSNTLRVDAFDFDPDRGRFANRRTVVEIRSGAATPDGMTVDAEGFLWVALWDGGAVHRYSPAGRLDGIIELPTRRVTACTFGGVALDELYVTTSRYGKEDSAEPAAGALFRVRTGISGLPVVPFAG